MADLVPVPDPDRSPWQYGGYAALLLGAVAALMKGLAVPRWTHDAALAERDKRLAEKDAEVKDLRERAERCDGETDRRMGELEATADHFRDERDKWRLIATRVHAAAAAANPNLQPLPSDV